MRLFGPIPANAIHLVVDMQELFRSHEDWGTPALTEIVPPILRLLEARPERACFSRFMPPEKIHFEIAQPGAEPGVNALRGRVTDMVFSGNSTTYHIAIGDQVMTLFRQNLTGSAIEPGAEVVLSWSGDHLVVVAP